nr:uncharacterized protein LOC111418516 [Onthophagus taurus]
MQHNFNLFIFLIAFLFGVKFGSANDYYWRDYNGSIPNDAIAVDDDLYIGQIYSHSSVIPGSLFPERNKFIYEYIGQREAKSDIKILCAPNPDEMKWVKLNMAEIFAENPHFYVSQFETTPNCVLIPGGYEHEKYRWYIGKIYHENMWKISKVDLKHFKAISVWCNNGGFERIQNFEVLYACKKNEEKLS